jgi:hypothetical protein
MAQRRPIASHPAFAPLVALWFAALLGLGVAVLPAGLVERALATAGLGSLGALGPLATSGAAAVLGAAAGWTLAKLLARRAARDPRPVYEESEPLVEEPVVDEPARRPLSIRDELSEGFRQEPDASGEVPPEEGGDEAEPAQPVEGPAPLALGTDEFLILSPQPVHPPRPAPDLDALLAQFDNALAAFRSDDEPRAAREQQSRPDPVHAFVARQTRTPAPSPLGGTVPDHQAELRAALDKLARARRPDE